MLARNDSINVECTQRVSTSCDARLASLPTCWRRRRARSADTTTVTGVVGTVRARGVACAHHTCCCCCCYKRTCWSCVDACQRAARRRSITRAAEAQECRRRRREWQARAARARAGTVCVCARVCAADRCCYRHDADDAADDDADDVSSASECGVGARVSTRGVCECVCDRREVWCNRRWWPFLVVRSAATFAAATARSAAVARAGARRIDRDDVER
jgi:hypothetical protein